MLSKEDNELLTRVGPGTPMGSIFCRPACPPARWCPGKPPGPRRARAPESAGRPARAAWTYPCQERSGVIWTYMGPRKEPPPLPGLEWIQSGARLAAPGSGGPPI